MRTASWNNPQVGDAALTFVFIDLAGFTALTEVHGDHDAADTIELFVDLVRESLGPEDRLVKTIGDAVMLTSPGPATAIGLTSRIIQSTHRERHFPQTRTGLNHGSAVERDGDYFGGAVNLAARVAAQAGADRTLATEEIAVAADIMEVDVVLVAVGRAPVTDGMGLEEAGIQLEGGYVVADLATMQTARTNIYAVGDVVAGTPQLAHAGFAEGIAAITHILQLDRAFCPRFGERQTNTLALNFDANTVTARLEAMELPTEEHFREQACTISVTTPGGVGDFLKDPDGGSWMKGEIVDDAASAAEPATVEFITVR